MNKIWILLVTVVIGVTALPGCKNKTDKNPLRGKWVVVDAIVTDQYLTREDVLNNTYEFTEDEMIYTNASFNVGSRYRFKYLDKYNIETTSIDDNTVTTYRYSLNGKGKEQQLTLSVSDFTYMMKRVE
jgi:hypothetical protein